MHSFPTFKPRTFSQESHWLNTLLFPLTFSARVFSNNSNNILIRVLHASCCNNLQTLLAYTISIFFLAHAKSDILVRQFSSQAITQRCLKPLPSFSTTVGLQSCSGIIQPTEEGRLYTCHSTTWPSCGTHRFYLHLVVWPYLVQEGLGNVAPGWLATSQQ